MDYAKIYLSMAAVFLAFDGLWLGLIAKNFYQKYLGDLMAKNPNFMAAAIFYIIYLAGLMLLVVVPAGKAHSLMQALWGGALFGLVCYATYDLTSQAVIKNWPVRVTLVDLAWGTFVSTVVALVGYWVANVLFV